ncbi:uncharacterized protein LOC120348057 isoform X3 [Styela clava]
MSESHFTDEDEGHISDIGSENEHGQHIELQNRGQIANISSNSNELAMPQERSYGVIDGDFRKQIYHNTYNTYITEQTSSAPAPSVNEKRPQRDTQDPVEDFGEGWIQLSDKIGLFKTRALCKRAHIYQGLHLSKITGNIPIAIKFLTPYDEANIKEANILLKLQHHHVVSIIHSDVYEEGPFPTMYIAMELCLTKTLYDYILEQRTTGNLIFFAEKQSMVRQLTEGLAFIHLNNVLHRDLKPENILFALDGKSLKISDFGLSKELSHGRSVTAQSMIRPGTDGYRAPETYNSDVISKQADIFSYGLVVYFILSDGRHAFGDEPDLWNYNIKKNKNLNIELPTIPRSETAKELIEWTLQFEPARRPSCKNILEHEFLLRETATKPKSLSTDEDYFVSFTDSINVSRTSSFSSSAKVSDVCAEGSANAVAIFDRDSGHISAFSPSAMRWIPMKCQKIPDDIIDNNFQSTRINNSIYVLMETKAVYRLDYRKTEEEWERVADMIENHGWFAPAEALDGCIYVVGRGYAPYPTSSRKFVEKYDPKIDKWTRVRDMNGKRENHYIAVCNGFIYCFAGRDEHWNSTVEVERYHAASDVWQNVSPMPRPMEFPPMRPVTFNDVIYVMNHSDIQLYDTVNDTWTIVTPGGPFPYDQAVSFAAFAVDNNIIGVGYKKGKSHIHRLELATMKWTFLETVKSNILPRECVELSLNRRQQTVEEGQVFHHYQ